MSDTRDSLLTGEEIKRYWDEGFLVAGKVLTDQQVDAARSALDECRRAESAEGREYNLLDPSTRPDATAPGYDPGGKSVGFLFNLWLMNSVLRDVAFNRTLSMWARQLIGTPHVLLLEDGAIYKDPEVGGELKWHQDFPVWPIAQPNAITAWVALDEVDDSNGAVRMARGSHLLGERLPASFTTGEPYYRDLRPNAMRPVAEPESEGLEVEIIELAVGEVSFHHPLTWHASGSNTSDRPRRGFVPRYVALGTTWLGAARFPYNYTDEQLGLALGDSIGGPLFPVLP